jgi:hypothetical protein
LLIAIAAQLTPENGLSIQGLLWNESLTIPDQSGAFPDVIQKLIAMISKIPWTSIAGSLGTARYSRRISG